MSLNEVNSFLGRCPVSVVLELADVGPSLDLAALRPLHQAQRREGSFRVQHDHVSLHLCLTQAHRVARLKLNKVFPDKKLLTDATLNAGVD